MIITIILAIIWLTLMDRWFYRKIIILERNQVSFNTYRIKAKIYMYFGIIRVKMDYIEKNGNLYSVIYNPMSKLEEISTEEVEPRMANKAINKYFLKEELNKAINK